MLPDILAVAREHNIRSILPAIFYLFVYYYTIHEIVNGERRPDGSLSILTADDQKTCILAMDKLIRLQAVETFGWLKIEEDGESMSCTGDCALHKRRLFRQIWVPAAKCIPLHPFLVQWAAGLCSVCAAECHQKYDVGRRKIWDLLPSIFGLASWDELLKDSTCGSIVNHTSKCY